MLEFNQEHKSADLSAIKSKTNRAKTAGKVMLCGIALSAVLLLSGCENSNEVTNEQVDITQPVITSTAIMMENGNAVIVDIISHEQWLVEQGTYKFDKYTRNWVLTTIEGDKIFVDFDSFKVITGENSHQKAETIAQGLIGENGQIICYDEVDTYGKTR